MQIIFFHCLYAFLILCSITAPLPLKAETSLDVAKHRILYLVQAKEMRRALALYRKEVLKEKRHDFPLLRAIAELILKEGASSRDDETQLIAMYGISSANITEATEFYKHAFSSKNPSVQLATIQFLSQNMENRAEEILLMAFSSPFLPIRLEAAYALASRRSYRATGVIDNLMQKLPPPFHIYFPELFAMIGSTDALEVLHRMVRAPLLEVRLAALRAAAHSGFDSILPAVRARITHPMFAEQEVCATALGLLGDSHSIFPLKKLTSAKDPNVLLAASHALALLGEHSFRKNIINLAAFEKNLFAIYLLRFVPEAKELLCKLVRDANFDVQINAAFALLERKTPACTGAIQRIFAKTHKHLWIKPVYSPGKTLISWKAVPCNARYAKKARCNVAGITLLLREQLLMQAVELPEEHFLSIAKDIFLSKQRDLIPLLTELLKNLQSPAALTLLKEQARRIGAPLIRNYCHLALYQLGTHTPHARFLFAWVREQKERSLFSFREPLSWTERYSQSDGYTCKPEEASRLLLEILGTLAQKHDPKGIDLLLFSMEFGPRKNCYALAGLLLKILH